MKQSLSSGSVFFLIAVLRVQAYIPVFQRKNVARAITEEFQMFEALRKVLGKSSEGLWLSREGRVGEQTHVLEITHFYFMCIGILPACMSG